MNATTNYTVNHPEMSGIESTGTIVARVTFGGKFYIKTTLPLKGRGVQYSGQTDTGKLTYTVTQRAFNMLCEKHDVTIDALLS